MLRSITILVVLALLLLAWVYVAGLRWFGNRRKQNFDWGMANGFQLVLLTLILAGLAGGIARSATNESVRIALGIACGAIALIGILSLYLAPYLRASRPNSPEPEQDPSK